MHRKNITICQWNHPWAGTSPASLHRLVPAGVLIGSTVSVPTNPHPDKMAISSDSAVFLIPREADGTRNRCPNSLQPCQSEICARHVGVLWWWELDGRKGGSYLWKAGCINSTLAQEYRCGSHLTAGWVELGEQSKKCGVEKGEADNVCQLIKHVRREAKRTGAQTVSVTVCQNSANPSLHLLSTGRLNAAELLSAFYLQTVSTFIKLFWSGSRIPLSSVSRSLLD